MRDKYSVIWVSHSSISDYLTCPRAYYLKNVYRNPATHHKIVLMSPSLALGQAVHQVIESISKKTADNRMKEPLIDIFNAVWRTVSGRTGGFRDASEEEKYKSRGIAMVKRITDHPGLLTRKAVKIRQDLQSF